MIDRSSQLVIEQWSDQTFVFSLTCGKFIFGNCWSA